jgi:uncharacterized MAPEG superfamily protein
VCVCVCVCLVCVCVCVCVCVVYVCVCVRMTHPCQYVLGRGHPRSEISHRTQYTDHATAAHRHHKQAHTVVLESSGYGVRE